MAVAVVIYLFMISRVVGAFTGRDATAPTNKTAPASTVSVVQTPEQIAQATADTELKAKQAEDAKVATEVAKLASLKTEAKAIPYKDLARTPDTYMGAKVKYTGEVIQVQEDGNNVGLRVNVTKGSYDLYSDTMYVTYDKGIIKGRVLDKDIISFWGVSAGLLKYQTVMGAEISIPSGFSPNSRSEVIKNIFESPGYMK